MITSDLDVARTLADDAGQLLLALRHEGALDEEDVLDRRTRIGLVPADRETALATVRTAVEAHGSGHRP